MKGTDLFLFLFYPTSFFLVWIATRIYADRKFKSIPNLKAVVFALEAVLFTVVGIVSYRYISDPLLKYIYRDVAISITGALLANAVFSYGKVSKPLQLITYLGFFGALAAEVFSIFTLSGRATDISIAIRKALILISLYPVVLGLIELLNFKRLKRFLKIFFAFIFALVGVLWEFNRIEFDITAFIGLGIIAAATVTYSWFATHGVILLKRYLKRFDLSDEDLSVLIGSLVRLGFLFLLYIYWLVAVTELNLGVLVEKLHSWVLIDTKLVRIDLYNLLKAGFVFFLLLYTLNVLKKVVKLFFPPEHREDRGGSLEAVIYNIGMLLNATVALSALGLSWQAILPIAGALGIGLGFGLQTILNNYVSGFILMFSRNIKVGDFVELSGSAGKFINNPDDYIFGRVEDISILTTRIKTLDGIDILVPNSTFIGNQIINYSLRNPYVRVRFPFGVSYSSDPEKVKEILLKLAYDCPWAKNFYKPPQVWFTELGDSALIFELRLWVDIRELWRSPYAVKSFSLTDWVYTNGFLRLKEAGIEIPFPQNDIWFRNNLKLVIEDNTGKEIRGIKKL